MARGLARLRQRALLPSPVVGVPGARDLALLEAGRLEPARPAVVAQRGREPALPRTARGLAEREREREDGIGGRVEAERALAPHRVPGLAEPPRVTGLEQERGHGGGHERHAPHVHARHGRERGDQLECQPAAERVGHDVDLFPPAARDGLRDRAGEHGRRLPRAADAPGIVEGGEDPPARVAGPVDVHELTVGHGLAELPLPRAEALVRLGPLGHVVVVAVDQEHERPGPEDVRRVGLGPREHLAAVRARAQREARRRGGAHALTAWGAPGAPQAPHCSGRPCCAVAPLDNAMCPQPLSDGRGGR